jgi:RNA polymerase sigma factor FliA
MGYDGLGVDEILSSGEPEPSDELLREECSTGLAAAVEQLPERERLVMSLYYGDELNLKEIGKVLGVTESRVCQIHSQALVRIRARLNSVDTN